MIGQSISHYTILAKLGEGGMGVVYKAHDTKLGRIVALKFLPRHLNSSADDEARLVREAQAVASLDHPNICTMYEVGTTGNETFLAMAYVEGETLRQKIKAGPLNLETIRSIARQIAEGIRAAHERGIVHRDIKSTNIMVTLKGQVKIMDFGLAKSSGWTQLTTEGTTLGTVAYMSPEQARGETVDQQTDIWALGIVMYEMLAGDVPFKSDYEQAVVYSILNSSAQSIAVVRPEVPPELERIVNRCLERDRANRYQRMDEVIDDLLAGGQRSEPPKRDARSEASALIQRRKLRRLVIVGFALAGVAIVVTAYFFFTRLNGGLSARESAGWNTNSLAVMYFENQSGEKDLDKMLVNMLTENLGRYKELEVVSDQRLFDILKALGKQDIQVIDKSVATEVAQRAHVRRMLMGSIIKLGPRIRISAQLLDTQTGEIIVSDHVDGTSVNDIFAMADGLTEKVSASFHLSGAAGNPLKITDVTTSSFEAYAAYQKGLEHMWRWDLDNAADDFAHAVTLDSTFALAYLQWAVAKAGMDLSLGDPLFDLSPLRTSLKRAQAFSARVTEKERGFINAYGRLYDRNYESADSLARILVRLYPDDKEATQLLSWTSWFLAKYAEDITACKRALEIDPTFAIAYNSLAYAYSWTNEHDEAISAIKKYMALQPDNNNVYDSAIEIFISAGDFDGAYNLCLKWHERDSTSHTEFYQSYILLFKGDGEKARERTQQYPAVSVGDRAWKEKNTGWLYIHDGRFRDAEQAFRRWIEIAHAANDVNREIAARSDMGKLLTVRKEYSAALDQFSQAKRLSSDPFPGAFNPLSITIEYLAGMAYVAKGDFSGARAIAARINATVQHGPYDSSFLDFPRMLLAECALGEGDGTSALEELNSISPIRRNCFPRNITLAAAIDGLNGNLEKAISGYKNFFNRIHTRNNYDGGDYFYYFRERSKVNYNLGRMYELRGDKKQAALHYSLALDQWKHADAGMPEAVDAQTRLAALRQ